MAEAEATNPMVLLNNHVTASCQRMTDYYVRTANGVFQCTLSVGRDQATGVGSNKKEAKADAAKELLKLLPGTSTPAQPPAMAPSTHSPERENVKQNLHEMVQKKHWRTPEYSLIGHECVVHTIFTGTTRLPGHNERMD